MKAFNWRLRKVVTGGQRGADHAALFVAYELGYKTGGFAARGYMTERGPRVAVLRDKYGLEEASREGSTIKLNVEISDMVIIFGDARRGGPAAAYSIARDRHIPVYAFAASEEEDTQMIAGTVRAVILQHEIEVLNVVGNQESVNPGIYRRVRDILFAALDVS